MTPTYNTLLATAGEEMMDLLAAPVQE